MKKWFWNILIAIDQLLNAAFGGNPDECLSSRWGKSQDTNKFSKMACNILDKIDKDHCANNIEDIKNRHGE